MVAVLILLAAGTASATQIGRGDFEFYLDAASFRGHDGKDFTNVAARIANSNLDFEAEKSGWKSRVTISLLVTDDAGKELIKTGETMTFHETDPTRIESSVAYQTIVKPFSLPPGSYWLSYDIEDMQAQKISVVGIAKGANKNAAVHHMRLVLPEMPTDLPSFSDALFVWDVDPRASGIRKYRPNPSHIYGLYRDSLTVYVELYIPGDEIPAPTLEFHSEIATQKGDPVRDTRISLPNPDAGSARSRTYPVVIHEDLSALEAGTYTLFLSFGLDGQSLTRIRAGDFSVAWDMRTWEIPRREYLAEARFLLGDDDFKKFQTLNAGQREKMLDERWKQYDPDPTTGTNEAYDTFLERLDYINAHYGDEGLAIFTDRGDIYVRYGPPDEFVQDVIPLNYDTLAEAEAVVDNPYHPLNLSSSGSKSYSITKTKNTFGSNSKSTARYREEDNTGVPYELWVYHRGGAPILDRDRIHQIDLGMRFLFVDRDGHGRYKLEKSSTISDK
jgi:GWxTD domain-containing protein